MPSQTDNFIRHTLHLAGPLRFLIEPFLAPIIGLEYLAGVQYHDDTPDVHYQQSPGASSSTDPMPTSVLGTGVHTYLTLADIARLSRVSQTAREEINQHGQDYVQTLLSTNVAQLSPVILNELILMGQPIQLPNGAFLNCLSDAAFRRYMAQQTNLHANDIIGLDRHHIGLLTYQQFYSAFNNSVGSNAVFPVEMGYGGFWLRIDSLRPAHGPIPQEQIDLVRNFLRMHYDYALTHPVRGIDPRHEHYNAVEMFRNTGYVPLGPNGDEIRRLSVFKEDIADNTGTSAYLIGAETIEPQSYLQTQLETSSDHDWIRIVLFKGNTYNFRMNNLGGDLDSYLTLRDAQGNQITYNDDSDGTHNSRITFIAEKSGVYYLDASSYASRSSGSYEISSNLVELGVNSRFVSELTSNVKNQLFKLVLQAGYRYEFSMYRVSTDTYFDAYLYLRDANKHAITYDDDSGGSLNSKIIYTAPSDGVYYLDASSYKQYSLGMFTVESHQII